MRACRERLAEGREEVLGGLRGAAHVGDRRLDPGRVAARPQRRSPFTLGALDRWVEPVELDPLRLVHRVSVDTDDHALALLDLALPAERGLLDLLLHPAGLDRRDCAAELVDPRDQLGRA